MTACARSLQSLTRTEAKQGAHKVTELVRDDVLIVYLVAVTLLEEIFDLGDFVSPVVPEHSVNVYHHGFLISAKENGRCIST